MFNKKFLLIMFVFACASLVIAASALADSPLTPKEELEELGGFLYFDTNLSQPDGQSCASCHLPDAGFVDPDSFLPVSEGVLPYRFGGRNSPSAAYAMYSPIRVEVPDEDGGSLYVGGQFWDSRATGDVLSDPLADQALGPFTNPVEMANHTRYTVVRDVAKSDYVADFEAIWNTDLSKYNKFSDADIDAAYEQVALSIAAFERTELFAPFNSKYDAYLQACLALDGDPDDCAIGSGTEAAAAAAIFSAEEWDGLQLFMGENDNNGVLETGEGAMCSACHLADWTDDPGNVVVPAWSPDGRVPPVFTDFTYDNLGVPKNLAYPFDPNAPIDYGLGGVVGVAENGKFKVMTLRNIGITAPYAHNGFFLTLEKITSFYNTRDDGTWPAPEVLENVNLEELGNLGLEAADEAALVAFMKTLTDSRYTP